MTPCYKDRFESAQVEHGFYYRSFADGHDEVCSCEACAAALAQLEKIQARADEPEPSPWTKAVSVCDCDRQRFREYMLTPQQVDKVIEYSASETYVIHMPTHHDADATPHIFCTDGSRTEITMAQALSI